MQLYTEFEPEKLLSFLSTSQSYPLEAALESCQAAGLVREQVRLRKLSQNSDTNANIILLQNIPGGGGGCLLTQ